MLAAWAETQSDTEPSATPQELAKHLQFLAATLPSRATDEMTAKLRFTVYARFLDSYSNRALAFMSRRILERMNWFPTPHQCLEILEEYTPPVGNQTRALMQCQRFLQERFEAWIDELKTTDMAQDRIDEVPEQWRRIATERGYLRRQEDGSFVKRKAAA